ncbi:MAG: hypothetical protein ACTSW1_06055 [Candidatus Hodarchaeales archaeon]
MEIVVLPPKRKRFKKFLVKLVLFTLGRSIVSVSRFDSKVKTEIENWPENTSIIFKVLPNGPSMSLLCFNKKLYKKKVNEEEASIVIYFKNLESAFMALTAQLSTIDAFMQHRNLLKGDPAVAMSLVRCLNIVQTYLFPSLIAKRVIKRLPKIPWYRKYYGRIRVFTIGITLGI